MSTPACGYIPIARSSSRLKSSTSVATVKYILRNLTFVPGCFVQELPVPPFIAFLVSRPVSSVLT